MGIILQRIEEKMKKLKIKEKKMKIKIKQMEQECDNNIISDKCSGFTCKDCSLNQKYKDFVGIGMDEIINYEE